MKPATEKKCEFNFLDSNGMMPHQTKRLLDNTENSVSIPISWQGKSKCKINTAYSASTHKINIFK